MDHIVPERSGRRHVTVMRRSRCCCSEASSLRYKCWRKRRYIFKKILAVFATAAFGGFSAPGVEGASGGGLGPTTSIPRRGNSAPAGGDDIDAVFRELEKKQMWGEIEKGAFEEMEAEAVEKKRGQLVVAVAKACSVGAQMTLIMGLGALFFSLVPVLLGHEAEDEDDGLNNSPYLLAAADDHHASRSLPAAVRRSLLTDARDASGTAGRPGLPQDDALISTEDKIVAGSDLAGDAEVIPFTKRRLALKKARRISRPFVRAMIPPLALLLAARFVLADLLTATMDPTTELFFGDDIVDMYSEKVEVPDEGGPRPFAQDSDYVPGRRKMKGTSVQRPPRPASDEEDARVE